MSSSLHDLLALGHVDQALSLHTLASTGEHTTTTTTVDGRHHPTNDDSYHTTNGDDGDEEDKKTRQRNQRRKEETLRLPLLLRWLAAAQPLASPPSLHMTTTTTRTTTQSAEADTSTTTNGTTDNNHVSTMRTTDLEAVVAKLEAAAASYPEAEGVDVLASYWAPQACRAISKLGPLSQTTKHESTTKMQMTTSSADVVDHGTTTTTTTTNATTATWDTHALAQVAAAAMLSPTTAPHHSQTTNQTNNKTKRTFESMMEKSIATNAHENVIGEDDDNDDDDDEIPNHMMDISMDDHTSKFTRHEDRGLSSSFVEETKEEDESSSFLVRAAAGEDSTESAVRRTLGELASLVVSSLDNHHHHHHHRPQTMTHTVHTTTNANMNESANAMDGTTTTTEPSSSPSKSGGAAITTTTIPSALALSVQPDSLLAEPPMTLDPAGTGHDLTAAVTALLHHAPVLRHSHLANALCRASVPQTVDLIRRMAANCPAAIPSLLRGCLDAYEAAAVTSSIPLAGSIVSLSRAAMNAIAALSPREAQKVMLVLQDANVLPDLVLQLFVSSSSNRNVTEDASTTAAFLIEHLSTSCNANIIMSTVQTNESKQETPTAPRHASLERGSSDMVSKVLKSDTTRSIAHGKQQRQHKQQQHANNAIPQQQEGLNHTGTANRKRRRIISSSKKADWKEKITDRRPLPNLSNILVQDKVLATDVRRFILTFIQALVKVEDTTSIPWGYATLLIRAYTLILYRVGIGAGSSLGSGTRFVEDSMTAIGGLATKLELSINTSSNSSSHDRKATSLGDEFRKMATCACIITLSRFSPIADAKQNNFMGGSAVAACVSCLTNLVTPSISHVSDVFVARVVGFLDNEDATELRTMIYSCFLKPCEIKNISNDDSSDLEDAFFNICHWTSVKVILQKDVIIARGVSIPAVTEDAMALVDSARRCSMEDAELDRIIGELFRGDPHHCSQLVRQSAVISLVTQAVEMLHKRPEPRLPLILPLHLEVLARNIVGHRHNSSGDQKLASHKQSQFILQLVYACIFLNEFPKSSFAIDPRALPMDDAILLCKNHAHKGNTGVMKSIESILKDTMTNHCPELLGETDRHAFPWTRLHTDHPRVVSPAMMSRMIASCMNNEKADLSGGAAERAFLQAGALFPLAEVDTAAASALLSTKYSPKPFFTYTALCRDPLTLLKCRVSIWMSRGLRRILLTILRRLLEGNCHITRNTAPTEDAAQELLAVRNLVVVRILLITLTATFTGKASASSDQGKPSDKHCVHCPMTIGIIRSLVSQHKGLVAMLIKQGLPNDAVDVLVEYVPECFTDAPNILKLLLERNSLTAPERLAAADGALRIAIAHGSRNDMQAQPLAYAALSILVSSFFLVVGAVGVPVSVLSVEGGKDVTLKCRESAFRMLSAIQKIRGGMPSQSKSGIGLKHEAAIALQKIASLCKSDNGMANLAGSAAIRRKAILKEIWDAVLRAVNSMGGAIQM